MSRYKLERRVSLNPEDAVGTSTVNRINPCSSCGKFTDEQTGELLHIRVAVRGPRSEAAQPGKMYLHLRCLIWNLPAIPLLRELRAAYPNLEELIAKAKATK